MTANMIIRFSINTNRVFDMDENKDELSENRMVLD